MKINTNLRPEELSLVSKGLSALSEKQRDKPFQPENQAEEELMREISDAFDTMLFSLSSAIVEEGSKK